MNTITREELKQKIDSGKNFLLLMCMSNEAFSLKHIPHSECFNINGSYQCNFSQDDEIIVYCSGNDCRFSTNAYNLLISKGYKNVYHYPGGLDEWEQAGYPLESSIV
jgi:rhodanese-related sulfurtransferase